jgi:signal transduction histidine kinase
MAVPTQAQESKRRARPDRARDHPFTAAEVAAGAEIVAREHPAKKMFLNMTMGHRKLVKRQSLVSLVIGVIVVLCIYFTELLNPSVKPSLLSEWVLIGLASYALRAVLFYLNFSQNPAKLATSVFFRAVPLMVVVVGASFWMWSTIIFTGPVLNPTILVIFLGYVVISLAIMTMWQSGPAVVAIYYCSSWLTLLYRLHTQQNLPWTYLLILALCVALALWIFYDNQTINIQTILDESDKTALLLAQLEKSNEELIQRNNDLAVLRAKEKTEIEARSLFFNGANHDFQQRLHAMKLLTHVAIEQTAASDQANQTFRRLSDCVEDVERNVMEVLNFARFDGTNPSPVRGRVRLQSVFQDVELALEDYAQARHVGVTLRSTLVELQTDSVLLRRILENLLSNAIKFSVGRVLVGARVRSDAIEIQVWDQGPGVRDDEKSSIFLPFVQSPGGGQDPTGVGLGLALVKQFADALGYRITVESRLGRGSVFSIWIPACDVSLPLLPRTA